MGRAGDDACGQRVAVDVGSVGQRVERGAAQLVEVGAAVGQRRGDLDLGDVERHRGHVRVVGAVVDHVAERIGSVEVARWRVGPGAVGVLRDGAVGRPGDDACGQRIAVDVGGVGQRIERGAAQFVQVGAAVDQRRGDFDLVHIQRHSCDVGSVRAVAYRVAECVSAEEVLIRRISPGAVGVDRDRAVIWLTDHRSGQRIAIDIGGCCQRVQDRAAVFVQRGAAVDQHWSDFDLGDIERDRGDVRIVSAVVYHIGKRIGAVEVTSRGIGPGAVGILRDGAVGRAGDDTCRQRVAVDVGGVGQRVERSAAQFVQVGAAVDQGRGDFDLVDAQRDRGDIGRIRAVADRVAERIRAIEILVRRVGPGAISVDGDRAVGRLVHYCGRERVAVDVCGCSQRIQDGASVFVQCGAAVGQGRGDLHLGYVQGHGGDIGIVGAVVDHIGERVGAVEITRWGVGPRAVGVLRNRAVGRARDDACRQRVAIDVGSVGQRVERGAAQLIEVGAAVGERRGDFDLGDVDVQRRLLRAEVGVVQDEVERIAAVVVLVRGVGPSAVGVLRQAAMGRLAGDAGRHGVAVDVGAELAEIDQQAAVFLDLHCPTLRDRGVVRRLHGEAVDDRRGVGHAVGDVVDQLVGANVAAVGRVGPGAVGVDDEGAIGRRRVEHCRHGVAVDVGGTGQRVEGVALAGCHGGAWGAVACRGRIGDFVDRQADGGDVGGFAVDGVGVLEAVCAEVMRIGRVGQRAVGVLRQGAVGWLIHDLQYRRGARTGRVGRHGVERNAGVFVGGGVLIKSDRVLHQFDVGDRDLALGVAEAGQVERQGRGGGGDAAVGQRVLQVDDVGRAAVGVADGGNRRRLAGGAVGLDVEQAVGVAQAVGADQAGVAVDAVQADVEGVFRLVGCTGLQAVRYCEFEVAVGAIDVERLRQLGVSGGAVLERDRTASRCNTTVHVPIRCSSSEIAIQERCGNGILILSRGGICPGRFRRGNG